MLFAMMLFLGGALALALAMEWLKPLYHPFDERFRWMSCLLAYEEMSETKKANMSFFGRFTMTWFLCCGVTHARSHSCQSLRPSFAQRPVLNKGTAFTAEERRAFHIEGRLPPRIETLEEQVERQYEQYSLQNQPRKYVYLRELQDYNRILYYSLVKHHLEEMLPIVYTRLWAKRFRSSATSTASRVVWW